MTLFNLLSHDLERHNLVCNCKHLTREHQMSLIVSLVKSIVDQLVVISYLVLDEDLIVAVVDCLPRSNYKLYIDWMSNSDSISIDKLHSSG